MLRKQGVVELAHFPIFLNFLGIFERPGKSDCPNKVIFVPFQHKRNSDHLAAEPNPGDVSPGVDFIDDVANYSVHILSTNKNLLSGRFGTSASIHLVMISASILAVFSYVHCLTYSLAFLPRFFICRWWL